MILLVVIAALALMYASSLRVYFNHRLQLAETRAEIAQREANIEKLQDEIRRWEDPEYVKAQARSRLGWVVPGEVGYRVIGPDGKPLGGGIELNQTADPLAGKTWWQRLWGSVEVADAPAAEATSPAVSASPSR
ncbi:MAG: septum formation initiator family protein [Propionibacteriaceae bacterium]|nr:septum formation initiator family protein [Propionibacteriaceae bacterium]